MKDKKRKHCAVLQNIAANSKKEGSISVVEHEKGGSILIDKMNSMEIPGGGRGGGGSKVTKWTQVIKK